MEEDMATFDELAAIQAGRKIPARAVDVEFGGEILTLEFQEIPGAKWADITARHPARDDSELDSQCGYNYTAAAREAASLAGAQLDGDARVSLTEAQWAVLVGSPATEDAPEVPSALDGNDYRRVVDAIVMVNEYDPIKRREELKKASKPAGPSSRKRS